MWQGGPWRSSFLLTYILEATNFGFCFFRLLRKESRLLNKIRIKLFSSFHDFIIIVWYNNYICVKNTVDFIL